MTYTNLLIDRIHNRRARKRLSHADVALALTKRGVGIDQATYRRWESGEEPIPFDALPALAASLGYPNVKAMLPSTAACEKFGLGRIQE